jgi:hypothetical protein
VDTDAFVPGPLDEPAGRLTLDWGQYEQLYGVVDAAVRRALLCGVRVQGVGVSDLQTEAGIGPLPAILPSSIWRGNSGFVQSSSR